MFTRSAIKHCRFGSWGVCLALLATPVWAGNSMPSAPTSFYQESKHGWFWYEDPASVVEEEREIPVTEPKAVPLSREVSLANYSTETLWNMHPDEFQQLLNGLQKKAVQYPTEQNILEYLSIQDIARRKALAYANATQFVTQKRADLFNINQVYPTSSPGAVARVQMQQEEIAGTIRENRDDHALLFFVAPGCGFCEKQAQILAYFVDKYGWQVKPVDIEREPNIALRFNITTTPTLLLIRQ
ncbi:MAG: conjugal transfer protein TraF, partial [Desulfobulbus sp.]|nr:conjugal transfer protein TraF [Desulfobulbus sp.]